MALTTLSRSLSGSPCLVTGAASGIGRATAFVLASEGAKVAVTDRDEDGVDAVAAAINSEGGLAVPFLLDVTDENQIESVVAEAVDRFGGLRVLVNNAGVASVAPVDAAHYEEAWDVTLDVNLTAYTRTVRACLPHLLAAGDGRIVNIASTEGLGASRWMTAYTASKHGVIGLTRGLAVELGEKGITVNAVCPGPIRTGMTAPISDEAKERYARRKVPVRRYGDPEEVGHMIASLCLPAASFCTGAVLVVDGGMTAKID